MNYPLTPSGQVRAAAAGLAEVADRYGRVAVISRAGGGTAALLDQTALELSSRRVRCVRVEGPASGALALRGLIAQLTHQPDPSALTGCDLTDGDLKAGFMALTEPGEGHDRVALLVAEAHGLLPSAVRYIQLACQSSPTKLCVVLAGQPSLTTVLAGDGLAYLRGAMHVMELPEPAGRGLFDPVSAVSEPRVMPVTSRAGGSSSLVRLGLAALIVPIVGLIWWRHLPAAPVGTVPAQDMPSLSVAAPAPAERSAEPAPSEPDPVPAPQAGAGPTEPALTETAPEPPASETPISETPASETPAKLEAPAESSAAETTELPAAATELTETPAPPAPPVPDPPVAKPPVPPHGTLTVTSALPARGGARRATPLAAQPTAASSARAMEDRLTPADEHRCRDIVLKAQLGKDPSDADTQFLRNGCRG